MTAHGNEPRGLDSGDHQSRQNAAESSWLQAQETYRDLILHRFPFEVSLGFRLAYIRTYASPRVARLLAHTGHVEHAPLKRATDTALFVYELIDKGIESSTGDTIIGRLNEMHARWNIRQDDYRWILATFIVLPTQVIDRYGYRRLSEDERHATVTWYRELGQRMGIHDIPADYRSIERDLHDYEQINLRLSEAGQHLLRASWAAGLSTLPAGIRPLARSGFSVLTDEPARSALGLPKPNALTTAAVKSALIAQSLATSRRPRASQYQSGGRQDAYPDGYTLDHLGVTEGRHPRAARSTTAPGHP